ncbi:hypothetical protein [Variovorax sp.]|jgi:DNA-binding transcriptional regulator/RsmH inhibitor MraZ|uniref:hypothetical protein n=1 Tax=Variovorax sp. TaxID=1871043 RepID=UPI00403804B4
MKCIIPPPLLGSAADRSACAQDAKPVASGLPASQQSHGPELEAYLIRLCDALEKQTAAMDRLSSSNEALAQAIVQTMAEEIAIDEAGLEGRVYLDGSPR